MLLTVTVNKRQTFKSSSLATAKRQASRLANRRVRDQDSLRLYVSSGPVMIDGQEYKTGSELWMRRINRLYPYKPGKWSMQ